jgi:dihydroflavonol-4-reductase
VQRTVFLTGASGFVGSHIARRFVQEGWKVKALLRRPDRPGMLPQGCEVVAGDLLAGDRYRRSMEGAHAVVHAAGATAARGLPEFRASNVETAEALARAARQAAPEALFLLVSSQSAAGPSRGGQPVREQDPPRPVSWYGRSKLEGEEAAARELRGRLIVIRPCSVYGPGDRGLLQLFSIVARGFAPVIAGGSRRIQLVSAEDLAEVFVRLAQRPDLTGRRLFAAGETLTMGELVAEIARLRRTPPVRIPVPGWAVWLAGTLESGREALQGSTRPFNRDKAREILQPGWICEAAPLREVLSIGPFRDWRSGIRETCQWYVREAWLPPAFSEL